MIWVLKGSNINQNYKILWISLWNMQMLIFIKAQHWFIRFALSSLVSVSSSCCFEVLTASFLKFFFKLICCRSIRVRGSVEGGGGHFLWHLRIEVLFIEVECLLICLVSRSFFSDLFAVFYTLQKRPASLR